MQIRVLRAVSAFVIASDGTIAENVLAVAVQASDGTGHEVGLGIPAELEIGNGTSRRSGRFPVTEAAGHEGVKPRHRVRMESLVLGTSTGMTSEATPLLPRHAFHMYAYLGEGMGTGEWMVGAGLRHRRHLPPRHAAGARCIRRPTTSSQGYRCQPKKGRASAFPANFATFPQLSGILVRAIAKEKPLQIGTMPS